MQTNAYPKNIDHYLRIYEREMVPQEPLLFLQYHLNSDVIDRECVYLEGKFANEGTVQELTKQRNEEVATWFSELEPRSEYQPAEVIQLPDRPVRTTMPLEEVVAQRRSLRDTEPHAISLDHLVYMLENSMRLTYSGTMTTSRGETTRMTFRPVPSGGGLFPIETYLLPLRVDGVAQDLYHYNPYDHVLERLPRPINADRLAGLFMSSPNVLNAAVVFLFTAKFRRSVMKYGERGYRFILLEAGAVVEHVILSAEALGLRGMPLGGFSDAAVNRLIGCNGVEESAVICAAVGKGGEAEFHSNLRG